MTDINNSDINRGIEIFLNGGKKKQPKFQIIFEKLVCFFRREATIYFEFSLNIGKK